MGTKKEIKNLDDKTLVVDIVKGISSDTVLKMYHKGFKSLNQNSVGDLLVSVKIVTPKKLTKTAEDLFKKLEKEL